MYEEKWMQEIEDKLEELKDNLEGKEDDVKNEIVHECAEEIITIIKQRN